MSWGSYLARGASSPCVFPITFLQDPQNAPALLHVLSTRRYMTFSLEPQKSAIFYQWEEVFSQAFDLTKIEKKAGGSYRSESGLAVGYRDDEEREFFETRLECGVKPSPSFDLLVPTYDHTVRALFSTLSHLAIEILTRLEEAMGLQQGGLVKLTDLSLLSSLSTAPPLSSTLLRICNYPSVLRDTGECQFGAHTDTSFLTFAPHSAVGGLEVHDPVARAWQAPEFLRKGNTHYITVFIGEFMEVVTKHRIKACVHRVRIHNNSAEKGRDRGEGSERRLSCPFIIRGYDPATISFHREKNQEEREVEQDEERGRRRGQWLAEGLEGLDMKSIHTLLDYKRQKCYRKMKDSSGEWVLSAFNAQLE